MKVAKVLKPDKVKADARVFTFNEFVLALELQHSADCEPFSQLVAELAQILNVNDEPTEW